MASSLARVQGAGGVVGTRGARCVVFVVAAIYRAHSSPRDPFHTPLHFSTPSPWSRFFLSRQLNPRSSNYTRERCRRVQLRRNETATWNSRLAVSFGRTWSTNNYKSKIHDSPHRFSLSLSPLSRLVPTDTKQLLLFATSVSFLLLSLSTPVLANHRRGAIRRPTASEDRARRVWEERQEGPLARRRRFDVPNVIKACGSRGDGEKCFSSHRKGNPTEPRWLAVGTGWRLLPFAMLRRINVSLMREILNVPFPVLSDQCWSTTSL